MPKGTRARPGQGLRFVEQVMATNSLDCIPWPYGQGGRGYGLIAIDGRKVPAHRLVLERTAGPPPQPNMVAAHAPVICHNRLCVNPRHLRWETPKGNATDREIDGTQYYGKGELDAMAKLTEAQVMAIRADGRPQSTIAAEYGIAQSTVSRIKGRQRWPHI